jgi:prolyl 4-hydroxylase
MPSLDASWQAWLATNAGRGCSAQSMIDAMVEAGFNSAEAALAVQSVQGVSAADAGRQANAVRPPSGDYQYDPCPVAPGNLIRAFDRDVKVAMRCERPQIIVFDDVLSAQECEELIARSMPRLKRSTTVNPETGSEDVIQNRSSQGTWYQRAEDAFIERIDRRLASLMNLPMENGEGLQVLHYGPGAEYRPHFDYFPPDQAGSSVHTARGGQRVATLIVYLNDVADGGETIFPDAGMAVTGRRGSAVYFRYMNGQRQLDPLTLHGGAPVRQGEKWIATRWMRESAHR